MGSSYINIILQRSQYLIFSDANLIFQFIQHFLIKWIIFMTPKAHNSIKTIYYIFEPKFHIFHFKCKYNTRQYDHKTIIMYITS